jgi:hypothetical protein
MSDVPALDDQTRLSLGEALKKVGLQRHSATRDREKFFGYVIDSLG